MAMTLFIAFLWAGIGAGLAERVINGDFDRGAPSTKFERAVVTLVVILFAPVFAGLEIGSKIDKE